MNQAAKIARKIAKIRFRLLGHATIKDIPTDRFNSIIKQLRSEGWQKKYVYRGPDAWLDYGCVKLKKDGVKLIMEWDNWTEGRIEGPKALVHELGARFGLAVVDAWRWSEYDQAIQASELERKS